MARQFGPTRTIKTFPNGSVVVLSTDYSDLITEDETNRFELEYEVAPGDHYEISDMNEGFAAQFIYVGHGWSLCNIRKDIRRGEIKYYITPSWHPHYYTGEPTEIPAEIFKFAREYVSMLYEPDDGYGLEA